MSTPLIFISYDRADELHRQRLETALAPLCHEGLAALWHARMLEPGIEWANEIDHNLAKADIVLLLISPDFIASDSCYEKEMKLALQRHQAGDSLVIPILVRPTDYERMPFAALPVLPKDARPVSLWSDSDAAWLSVVQGVARMMGKGLGSVGGVLGKSAEDVRIGAELGQRTRAMPPPKGAYDAAWYLNRADEQERARIAWEAPGAPIVLQAPELFGKTWVLMHLLGKLQTRGRTVYINLKSIGNEALVSFSGFLREIGRLCLERCALPDTLLEQAWQRSSNPEANLTWLLITHVLPPLAGAERWLVLAFDGIDALADKPYFDRFLTLLRGMAETASIAPWGALRLVLTLSLTIALRGLDIHRSPLENVAQIITLSELSTQQVLQMASWYGRSDSEQALKDLSGLVGGHPYLVHLALHEAQHRKQPLDEILLPKARVFDSYLQMCRKRLQQHPELYQALRAIIADERTIVNEDFAARLIDAGFLADDYDLKENRVLRLRYRLYRRLG